MMLTKEQIDVLDDWKGECPDENYTALLAHARESLTEIRQLRGALEHIQVTTQERRTEKKCEDALGQAAIAPTAPTSAEDEPSAARDIPGYAEMCVKIAKDLEREQQAQGMVLLWQELWDGGILTQEQSDEIARRIKAHRKGGVA